MLTHLSIRNIVLVEKADIPFKEGLCVLSGETGAGKSILLDALGLALGRRAEARLVRSGADEASVSAQFDLSESLKCQLTEIGINIEEGMLIIRRNLSADGKSKAFMNDTPVSLSTLKAMGEQLVEVHGQHDQRGLMEPRQHVGLLDRYGAHDALLGQTGEAYEAWKGFEKELRLLMEQLAKAQQEKDYLEHLVEELSALNVTIGEADALADKRAVMMQSEKLAGTLTQALSGLQGEGSNPASMLREVQRLLLRAQPAEGALFESAIDALEKAQVELQQAEEEIERLQEACAYQPAELERTEERLFAIRAVARKHGCEPDALPELCAKSAALLTGISQDTQACAALRARIDEAKADYVKAARALSDQRLQTAAKLEKALLKELSPLKMAKTRFRVSQTRLEESAWHARGMDAVQFEAATNVGQEFAPLHQIASGGELSRFMLALKAVLSSVKSTPTLIFDEIDTGTGGAVADAIGARLALIAKQAQVLVVTHLPQVAARGQHHLFIEKREVKGATQTLIRVLGDAERQEELARMLAGAEVTAEARQAAGKLLEAAG